MKIRTLLAAVAAVAVLAGCAVGNDRLKNMTTSQVAALVTDNQTTQAAVVKELGSPNSMHQEADGTKVLEYTWVRQRPSAKNFIPLNVIKEFPTTKKTLLVWVDDAGVVKKHELSGVFYVYRQPLIMTGVRELSTAEVASGRIPSGIGEVLEEAHAWHAAKGLN